MSEKQQQLEICIMINVMSQCDVAVIYFWWDIWPELYFKFTAECFERIFKIAHIWQSYGEKL